MKVIVIVTIFIVSSIHCAPIEHFTELTEPAPEQDSLSNDQFYVVYVNNSEPTKNQTFIPNINNTPEHPSRMSVPDDVEWLESEPKNEKQQVVGPVGNIVEMIFAVSLFITFYPFHKIENSTISISEHFLSSKFKHFRCAREQIGFEIVLFFHQSEGSETLESKQNHFCLSSMQIPIGVLQTVRNLVRSVTTRTF